MSTHQLTTSIYLTTVPVGIIANCAVDNFTLLGRAQGLRGTIIMMSTLPQTRNNEWLAERLAAIWQRYFPDVEQKNSVLIRFGRKSKTRLGSIGMNGWQGKNRAKVYRSRNTASEGSSVITITGYFEDPAVPEYVIDATVGHELVHYAHGFHSPYPQLYRYPHQGRIVDLELRKRGMGEILRKQQLWLKQEWKKIAKRRPYGRMHFLRHR